MSPTVRRQMTSPTNPRVDHSQRRRHHRRVDPRETSANCQRPVRILLGGVPTDEGEEALTSLSFPNAGSHSMELASESGAIATSCLKLGALATQNTTE